jgi:hypothetical protein
MSPVVDCWKETSTASRSRAASCSVAWGFGFRRTGLWARRPRPRPRPAPRCTWCLVLLGWWRPRYRYAQKTLVRACASSPEISRGGHGATLPGGGGAGARSEPPGPEPQPAVEEGQIENRGAIVSLGGPKGRRFWIWGGAGRRPAVADMAHQ